MENNKLKEAMEKKYIGIKPGGNGRFEPTNLGTIFVKQENGKYKSINHRFENFEITEEEVLHDLNKGYLKPLKD